jgi:GTP-binding protein LepA
VGDTITDFTHPASAPLHGYKKILPMVFCGIYPIDNSQFDDLKDAMQKITLSDSSLTYEYETSQALGYGIRCGFLGLLHMDVIRERIQREYNIDLIMTAPSVKYRVIYTNNTEEMIDNPSKLVDRTYIKEIQEPFVKLTVVTPENALGAIIELCNAHRGIYKELEYIDSLRHRVTYEIPLGEIIYNFFDNLKTISRGYATMDYEFIDYRTQNLIKVDILLNGTRVDALSFISHRDFSYSKANRICLKLKEHIPRQQFEIPIQAAIGGKIIARETIKAIYKNVLAKCYGGDVSRKKKLLEQQKEGKKKLKSIGNVSVPQDVFIKLLSDE